MADKSLMQIYDEEFKKSHPDFKSDHLTYDEQEGIMSKILEKIIQEKADTRVAETQSGLLDNMSKESNSPELEAETQDVSLEELQDGLKELSKELKEDKAKEANVNTSTMQLSNINTSAARDNTQKTMDEEEIK